MDRVSLLEYKFEALMTRLSHQTTRETTIGEIAYMQAQGAMMANPPFQVEEANYVSNRGYTFRPNHNLPLHYYPELRNHENYSYGNQVIVPHEPHQLSTTMVPPDFQNQGASSSNYQRNTRQPCFNELLLVINDMKKTNDTRIMQLENG